MRLWSRRLGWLGGEAPELEVRRGPVAMRGSCTVVLTLVLLFVGISLMQLLYRKSLESSWAPLGPCRAQPRLVQRTVEHHIWEDGDFELLFRPAVLFGKFEFFWRSQIF